MEENYIPEPPSDHEQSVFAETKKETSAPSRRKARRKRVEQFEMNSLKELNAFDACLALLQADQLRLSFEFADVLKQALSGGAKSIDDLNDLDPTVNNYLRLVKQVERLALVKIRASELRAKRRDDGPLSVSRPMDGRPVGDDWTPNVAK